MLTLHFLAALLEYFCGMRFSSLTSISRGRQLISAMPSLHSDFFSFEMAIAAELFIDDDDAFSSSARN